MTLYEQMLEMYEDEQKWIMENSTTDDNEYEEYLNKRLGYNRELNYSSHIYVGNGVWRHIFDLNEVAIVGKVFVVNSGLSFVNPTKLDLAIAAEFVIHNTGDYHAVVFEGWEIEGGDEEDYFHPGIKYCTLHFGS